MKKSQLDKIIRETIQQLNKQQTPLHEAEYRCVCGSGAGMSDIHGWDTPSKCQQCCKGKGVVKPGYEKLVNNTLNSLKEEEKEVMDTKTVSGLADYFLTVSKALRKGEYKGL